MRVTTPTRSSRDEQEPCTALLLENIHPVAEELLSAAGMKVRTMPGALDESELVEALQDVDLLGIRSKTQVTSAVLEQAPRLLSIGAFCIGTNQIDLKAASKRGVAVFNAPFSNTRSVVELALAEVIALTRRLTQKNHSLHSGLWDKSASGAHEVRGRRLGIVGYGNIGSQLSVLAEGLGMSVSFYDVADKLALGNAQSRSTLEQVLEEADVVSLHVDGRPGNAGIFGEEQFSRMKPGAIFINLSRGFVADHEALREHILSGHLSGAAIDVFPDEPKRQGDEFHSTLRGLPNVILTPHIGGSTEEAQEDIGRFVAGKLYDFVRNGATTLSVNLPGVALEHAPGTHRLAHLHHNVPGVLARVNAVLGDRGVNIEGQVLTTLGDLGYLLTDVGLDYAPDVIAELAGLPETVELRIID
ncbi:MAG TPA: phosphoglycerate dehydrogenase [Nocardioidaceae bacterium]|nr:phosphoglycerate dehydrogenase [Nocardioidaceae bacterium]